MTPIYEQLERDANSLFDYIFSINGFLFK